jgi:hypothetical protein
MCSVQALVSRIWNLHPRSGGPLFEATRLRVMLVRAPVVGLGSPHD